MGKGSREFWSVLEGWVGTRGMCEARSKREIATYRGSGNSVPNLDPQIFVSELRGNVKIGDRLGSQEQGSQAGLPFLVCCVLGLVA